MTQKAFKKTLFVTLRFPKVISSNSDFFKYDMKFV